MYKLILSGILTTVVSALCLGTLTSAKEQAKGAKPATIKLADGKKVPIVHSAATERGPEGAQWPDCD